MKDHGLDACNHWLPRVRLTVCLVVFAALSIGARSALAQTAGGTLSASTPTVRDETAAGAGARSDQTIGPFYRISAATPEAADEPRPLSLTVRQGWRHSSNLYALSPAAAQALPALSGADSILVTGLKLAYERRISAQEVALWADLANNSYRRFDDLSHVAWNVGGNWNWQVGRQWYGTLAAGSQRFLNPFANQNQTIRNQVALNALASSVGYRFGTRWSAFVGADFNSRRNFAADSRGSDLDQSGLETGIRYQHPTGDVDTSVVIRGVRGSFPTLQQFDALGNAITQPVDNAFRDRSVLLRAALRPSAPSYIVGEVGWTSRQFDSLSTRNFSGLTGSFLWRWQPTDPLRSEFYVRRNLGAIQLGSSNFIDTVQAGLTVSWRIAAKVTLGAHAGWDLYRFGGDPLSAVGVTQERRDRLRTIGVSATWQAWRNVALIADHRREIRTSNYEAFRFDADITSVFVQARFD